MTTLFLGPASAKKRGLLGMLGRQCIARAPEPTPDKPWRTQVCTGRVALDSLYCLGCEKRLKHQDQTDPTPQQEIHHAL